jgi:hypothetical protein
MLALAACSGSSDDTGSTTTSVDPAASAGATGSDESGDSTDTTEVLRDGVVAFEDSVESVILDLPEAQNFAVGVEEWLAAVPGQEGVLRNSRGITVFVPVDDGFSEADRDAAFADPDLAAVTIGDHLHVGTLEDLDGTIVVATGAEYVVADDGDVIAGRRVVRSVTAANGVVYLIDGPLTDDAG